jgi:hypothetical protein
MASGGVNLLSQSAANGTPDGPNQDAEDKPENGHGAVAAVRPGDLHRSAGLG